MAGGDTGTGMAKSSNYSRKTLFSEDIDERAPRTLRAPKKLLGDFYNPPNGLNPLFFRLPAVLPWIAGALTAATLFTLPAWGGSNAAPVWRREWLEPRMRAAAVLDRAMDDCGIERYMNFIDRPDGTFDPDVVEAGRVLRRGTIRLIPKTLRGEPAPSLPDPRFRTASVHLECNGS